MDTGRKIHSNSDINISDRRSIDIGGVDEIISYDDRTIMLCVCGTKTVIEGEELKITVLSLAEGKVAAKGKINAVIYEEDVPVRKGLFSKIFKR